MSRAMNALRKVALSLDDVSEGIACEGTALERRTLKVSNKAFLFLGPTDALLKLTGPALTEATKASKKNPNIHPGKTGWVKITFDDSSPPPSSIDAWIRESYVAMKPSAKEKAKPKPKPKVKVKMKMKKATTAKKKS